MRDPSKFYDEQRHRRLMPKQDLREDEITDLIAFLDWVSKVDNQGWPPRPILVTGAAIPGTDLSAAQLAQSSASTQARHSCHPAQGRSPAMRIRWRSARRFFASATPACNACHSTRPGVNMAGPSLAGLATRARVDHSRRQTTRARPKDVADYIRESIREPSTHVVPGAMYSANGVSFMPNTYART